MDLVILAAGMGSRFGGLKQLTPIDENGNFIIDYSIYDAIRCGFDRIVFIVKEETYETFRETVGKRIEDKIKVEYAFQSNDNFPKAYPFPDGRVKPFGTGHALLCCKGKLSDKFAVINADDFYGYDALRVVADFLKGNDEKTAFCMAGYSAVNTLSEHGTVKRGVCEGGRFLTSITESIIRKDNGKILACPIDGGQERQISPNQVVSMSIFGFKKALIDYLDEQFEPFIKANLSRLDSCEYLLPTELGNMVEKGRASVEILKTSSQWYGMTYKEEREMVISAIKALRDNGQYPQNLWQESKV